MTSYRERDESGQSGCCSPYKKPRTDIFSIKSNSRFLASRHTNGEYTDSDLARDLNALTMEERRTIEEDIHGVSEDIPETDDFVEAKIKEMNEHIAMMNASEKQAWERAIFLRPSLEHDKPLRLMFLRARRFQSRPAARAMIRLFEKRQQLFGDLMIQRLIWDDLSTKEQEIIRSGIYQLIPGLDRPGRGVAFSRVCQWQVHNNHRLMLRCMHYMQAAITDDVDMQRKGVIGVTDFGGTWKSTPLQLLQYFATIMQDHTKFRDGVVEGVPFYDASSHILYNDTNMETLIRGFRHVFQKSTYHLRFRTHFGSDTENEYQLRSFGINLTGMFAIGDKAGPLSAELLEKDIQRRQDLDEKWRRTEAPYRDPSSRIALYPNQQDVIMGRNKKIALSWPGSMAYHQLIERFWQRYMDAQARGNNRIDLTVICMEIKMIVEKDYRGRFLSRKETTWEVCDDAQIQKKIGQALRMFGHSKLSKKQI